MIKQNAGSVILYVIKKIYQMNVLIVKFNLIKNSVINVYYGIILMNHFIVIVAITAFLEIKKIISIVKNVISAYIMQKLNKPLCWPCEALTCNNLIFKECFNLYE